MTCGMVPVHLFPRQVLQGKVQVRTRHREAFAVRLEAASRPSRSSSVEDGRLSEGGQDASEEEMLALFNSIDVDGSGGLLAKRAGVGCRHDSGRG